MTKQQKDAVIKAMFEELLEAKLGSIVEKLEKTIDNGAPQTLNLTKQEAAYLLDLLRRGRSISTAKEPTK